MDAMIEAFKPCKYYTIKRVKKVEVINFINLVLGNDPFYVSSLPTTDHVRSYFRLTFLECEDLS